MIPTPSPTCSPAAERQHRVPRRRVMPSSKLKEALAKILEQRGLHRRASRSRTTRRVPAASSTITMKYTPDRKRTISGLQRVSKPGLRVYTKADRRAARARRHGHRHPVDQPGPHDRPRGAPAPRRRRDPLPGLVGANVPNRQAADPSPERRRRDDRRPPRHGQGPEGHPRARRARDDHRQRATATSSSSRAPTTSARTARCTASPARSWPTWSRACPRASAGSSRSSASATAPSAAGPSKIELRSGYSHPVPFEAPRGHHLRGAGARPASRCRARQAARRPGGRRHPQDPQARAVQGQGHPLRRRARPAQGRQVGEVGRGRRRCTNDKRGTRSAAHRRVRKKVPGHAGAAAARGVPLEQAHLRAGHRRRRRPHARGGVDGREGLRAAATARRSRRPRRSASAVGERAKAAGVDPWCSTAAGSGTTAASRRRRRRAKPG